MNEKAMVTFLAPKQNIMVDLEIPLGITVNELVIALNSAYNLGIDVSDTKNCFLKSENPIAFLKGNRLISDFGVRNGTALYYTE